MATPLENKEIKGLTWKTAVIVLFSTISICVTVLTGVSNIRKDIAQANNRSAMNEISIREMRIRLDKMDVDVQQLKEQYYQLTYAKKP